MKHTPSVTTILVLLFIASQLVGLGLVAHITPTDYAAPSTGEAAQRGGALLAGVLIGTLVLLLLIKFKLFKIWKLWYFLAVWFAIGIALEPLLFTIPAMAIGLALAVWKVFYPNILVHNLTEVLVYSGIALLVTVSFNLNLLIAALLLLLIALYDMYAVWKSKHMVKMAQFQTESKMFAGLLVPYDKKGTISMKRSPKKVKSKSKTAVLGGGDIAFPLIFAATTLQWLVALGISRGEAFMYTLPIVLASAAALLGLFLLAKKDRFYPAMPFLAIGCYAGFAVTWLISTIRL